MSTTEIDLSPDSPPPRPPARPCRLRFLGWGLAFIVGVIVLFGVLLGSSWGLNMLARGISALSTQLKIERAEGRLDHLVLSGVQFQNANLQLQLDRLELAWSPLQLRSAHVDIQLLKLGQVDYQARQPSSDPLTLPSSLASPVTVQVQKIELGGVTIDHQPILTGLLGRFESQPQQHRLTLSEVRSPWGQMNGGLSVQVARPFALKGQLAWAGGTTQQPSQAQLAVTGSLSHVQLQLQADSLGLSAQGKAELQPFAGSIGAVVQQAQLTFAHWNPASIVPSAPTAMLSGELLLPKPTGPNAERVGVLSIQNVQPGHFSAQHLPFHTLSTQMRLNPDGLALSAGRIALLGGALGFDGQITRSHLNLQTQWFDVNAAECWGSAAPATEISGVISVQGRIEQPVVAVDWRDGARKLTAQIAYLPHTSSLPPRVQLKQAVFSEHRAQLNMSGEWSLAAPHAFSGRVSSVDIDLSRFWPSWPRSQLNVQWQGQGALLPKKVLESSWTILPSTLQAVPLSGHGKVHVQGDHVESMDVALHAGHNHVVASGAFGRRGERLAIQVDAPALAELGAGFSGRAALKLAAIGEWLDPQVEINASANNLRIPSILQLAQAELHGALWPGTTGRVGLSGSLQGLSAAQLDVRQLTVSASGVQRDHRLTLAAQGLVAKQALDMRIALQGGLSSAMRWQGKIEALSNQGAWPVSLSKPVKMSVSPELFTLESADVQALGGRWRLAQWIWKKGEGIQSKGTFSRVSLLPWLAMNPRIAASQLDVGGAWDVQWLERLAGQVQIFRERGDFSVLPPDGGAHPLALGLKDAKLLLTLNHDQLRVQGDLASALGGLSMQAKTSFVREGGRWRWGRSSLLDAQLDAEMTSIKPLGVLLNPWWVVDGRLRARVTATGTVGTPRLSGHIDGGQLAVRDARQGWVLEQGVLRAGFNDQRLTLEQLRFKGGDGWVESDGSLLFSSRGLSANLKTRLHAFTMVSRPDRLLVGSGQINAQWGAAGLSAEGAIRVDRGSIEIPRGDTPRLSEDVIIHGRASRPEAKATWPIHAVLSLDLGDQLHVFGRGVDVNLGGVVKLSTKPELGLVASGAVKVLKGQYVAYGQNLAIERGIVNFQGALDNPGLDIVAMRRAQNVAAGVAISGTVNSPRVRLVSEPSVPDIQKLSWLVLGKQSLSDESSDSQLLMTAASALLSDSELMSFQQRMAHQFGLDDISIGSLSNRKASVSNSGTPLEGRVIQLGKRLSDKVYLSYEQGLAGAGQLVKLSYQLNKNWSFSTRAGDESAADIFYTLRFD